MSKEDRALCFRIIAAYLEVRSAPVLLKLSEGLSYRELMRTYHDSRQLIRERKRQYVESDYEGALRRRRPVVLWPARPVLIFGWIKDGTPRYFGFFSSGWTC